ncbi:translation initiation factor IF-2 [Candidatus Neomarinimicrobiota bacterium]
MVEQVGKKKRVFQIAKELNISHTEIMEFLNREGIEASTHMSPVEHEIYDRILGEFAKEKVIVDRHRKEMARRDVEQARQETGPKQRFERILTIEEQRDLEKREIEKAQLAAEEAVRKQIVAEKQHAQEENLKIIAHEALKKRQAEEANAAVKEQAARKSDEEPEKSAESTPDEDPAKDISGKGDKTKTKLKRIDMTAIASKVDRGRKKHGKRGRSDKLDPAKAKSVDQTLRQTLASMGTKDKRRRPVRKDRQDDIDIEIEETESRGKINVHEFMAVNELAHAMDMDPMEVIATCMKLGMMVTINQRLDMDTITVVAEDLGFIVESDHILDDDSILGDLSDKSTDSDVPEEKRPPIVTVMGHVDHGKTSLLDYIRKTNVVGGESGGITQHIGAHEVTLPAGDKITFLDTPGHAAFTAMRARGAQVTDIVILIVAADDAVMPQTIEAIDHAKAANVNIVVAINKIDKPEADTERVKRELAEHNILVEDWGGKFQCAEISAKSGAGVPELLDKILLEAEMLDLKAPIDTTAIGTVIESRLDRGLGAVATVLIEKGTLSRGDVFICGTKFGRIRAMQNERGKSVKTAYPSDPVLVQGFDSVPQAGDRVIVFEDEKEAKRISAERSRVRREIDSRQKSVQTLDEISRQIREGKTKQLSIILKADVDGSLEALRDSFDTIGNKEVAVNHVHHGVGNVSQNDVLLAKTSGSVIIAFRVGLTTNANELVKKEKVDVRRYEVIYDAVNEIKLALEGLLEPDQVETPLGVAEVRATFKIPKLGLIAGCYLTDGKAVRNAYLRVKRDGETLHQGDLTSLKRFKDDVKEVQEGYECGIGVEGFTDFHEGDLIEIYELKEVKRTLA